MDPLPLLLAVTANHLDRGNMVEIKYERLVRTLKDVLEIVDAIKVRGMGFPSLAEDIDDTTFAGRSEFHVFAATAQFDWERTAKRTKEGLEATRELGRADSHSPCPPC